MFKSNYSLFFIVIFMITLVFKIEAAEFIVNTVDDNDDTLCDDTHCSLRDAINAADNHADTNNTIRFSLSLTTTPAPASERTLALTSKLPIINKILTIDASQIPGLIITGDNSFQLMEIEANSELTLKHMTLTQGNDKRGSGISVKQRAQLTLINTTLQGNTARDGGSIYALPLSELTLINTTIVDNQATREGGGIYTRGATVTLDNTIIAQNTASTSGNNCLNNGSTYSGDFNLFDSTECVTGNNNITNITDIFSEVLEAYNADLGVYPLKPNSPDGSFVNPAIDAIPQANCFSLNQDQIGQLRPIDGNRDGTPACDIGAYERLYFKLAITPPTAGRVISTPAGIDCGTGSPGLCQTTYLPGTEINWQVTPDTSGNLVQWQGDCDPINGRVILDAAKSCALNFVSAATLTINPLPTQGMITGQGISCGSQGNDCSESYPLNTAVSLTATADNGADVTIWQEACRNGQVIIDNHKICSAQFVMPYPLSVTASIGGSVKAAEGPFATTGTGIFCGNQGNDCTEKYVANTTITLTPSAAPGYLFENFGGDCTAQGRVTMSAPGKSCSVQFTKIAHTVTVTPPRNGKIVVKNAIDCGQGGSGDCAEIYTETQTGKLVSFAALPSSAEYQFDQWQGDCAPDGWFRLETVTQTCSAAFKPIATRPTTPPQPTTAELTLIIAGDGHGTITNEPYPDTPFDVEPFPIDNLDDLSCRSTECRYTYDINTFVQLTPHPAEDSTFIGWMGIEDCGDGQLVLFRDVRCKAYFKLAYHKLTVTQTGRGNIIFPPEGKPCSDEAQCQLYAIDTQIQLTAQAGPGYIFSGWRGDCQANGQVKMNQAQQCEALFTSIDTLPQLTLSYEGNGQGQVNLAPTGTACGENRWCYAADTEVSLTPVAHEQSTFEGWQGHEDCQEGQITMETDKRCVARFNLKPVPPPTEPSEPETPPSEPETPPSEPETPPSAPEDYTLTLTRTGQGTVTSIPSGIECGSTCSHTYSADTAVTLTATAAEGFIFAGWQGDCVNGQVMMKAHQQCQAIFRPTYTLSVHTLGQGQVKSYPEGIECNNACQAVYPQHTQVTLTPLAAAGSVFSGWQGDCAPSGQVNMDRHQSCQATFEALPTLQFTVKQLTVEESSTPVKITVSRSGQMTAAVSVDYHTVDGSALADQDYRPVEGRLNWAAGDHSDRTISLELIADRATEADETLFLNLAAPSGGAVLGTPQQLELIINDTPWFSSVQLALPHYTVNEAAGHAVVLVSRAGSKQWPVAVDYTTSAESAQADIDYTSVSGILEWLDGDRSHLAIEIPILADGIEEANESFILTLTNPTHEAQLGPHAQAVVTIIDTPAAGSLEFAEAEYSVEEQSGALEINVKRIGGTMGAVSVEYTTVDGSAIAGEDYPLTQGSLHWAAGDNQPKSFTLPIVDDDQAESQEHLTLRLAEPTGYANLGALAEVQLSIADNDSAASGKLQWASSQYSVNEQHNQVTIVIQRVEGHYGERTLQYHTQDDTAAAGQDYTSAQGELHWPDGEAGERSFTISLIDDARVEATETFSINLTAPDLNEQLQIAIEDNDSSPLQFTFGSYVVAENSPEAIVTVSRQGEGLNPVSVHYQTLANSAQAGTDYQAQEGTLSWFSGDNTPKTIAIPLIYDQAIEGNETLQVQLTGVNGPATLGTPASTTIIITEDDLSGCTPEPIIDCILMNHGHTLGEDYAIEITPRGAIIGGQLSGIINNAGEIRDVTLALASTIQGGHVGGHIKGQAPVQELRALDAPNLAASTRAAVLRDVVIKPMTLLEYVTIGRGAELGHSITLGQGVHFEDNSTIPDQVDLSLSLGRFKPSILGQRAVRLNDDVLIQAPSILATINQLHELQAQHLNLRQDSLNGYLQVQVGPMQFKVLPLRVEHLLKQQTREYMPLGMTIMDTDQVVFVTHTGRKVTAQPVVHDVNALQTALQHWGLPAGIMQQNGNIKIYQGNSGYFSVRPSLFALAVSAETPLGLSAETQVVTLTFDDAEGQRWQQFFYPAAGGDLSAHSSFLDNEGQVVLKLAQQVYQGQLDYWIAVGTQAASETLQILEVDETHHQIIYPNGESQLLLNALDD